MAIEHGATTFVVFHRLGHTSQVPTDYSIADFRRFIDYVVRKRDEGLIEPMTVSAWYESLPGKKGVAAQQRKPRIEELRSNSQGGIQTTMLKCPKATPSAETTFIDIRNGSCDGNPADHARLCLLPQPGRNRITDLC